MPTRGFTGRRPAPELADRVPPGQSLTDGFPVLTAGPTPRVSLSEWSFTLKVGPRPVQRWTWAEFQALPQTKMTRDIHCVTKWSKLNTPWTGVLIDDLLAEAGLEPPTPYILAHSYDARAWWPGTTPGATPLFLEIGEVDQWASIHRARRGRFLGAARLSHLW